MQCQCYPAGLAASDEVCVAKSNTGLPFDSRTSSLAPDEVPV